MLSFFKTHKMIYYMDELATNERIRLRLFGPKSFEHIPF